MERCVWTERRLTRLTQSEPANRVWYALVDKTYAPANLQSAFHKVWQKGGSAGADAQTVGHFARHAEAELQRLHEQLRDGTYEPQPVRRPGTIGGAVTVEAGASVGAGESVGILTMSGGLDLSAGGTNIWELAVNSAASNEPGVVTNHDQIILTAGALDASAATLIVKFIGSAIGSDPFWTTSHSWTNIVLSGGSNPGPTTFAKVVNATSATGTFTTAADGAGNIVITYTPGAVPVSAIRPRITSITGAGTAIVTVNYTNTVPTKTYFLRYKTNINGGWTTNLPGKIAVGTSDFQIDTPLLGGSQRYYQVYYVAP